MGPETRFAAQAAVGELVIDVPVRDGYRLWASSYDQEPNPLLALEMRTVGERLPPLAGRILVDVAAGTGRWAAYARTQGASVIAFDRSAEMLRAAGRRNSLKDRLAIADMLALPIRDEAADVAICSFALGYAETAAPIIAEMARIARWVIVSDLHPHAVAAGWSRSFRSGGETYRIQSYCHSLATVERAAIEAGLLKRWQLQAHLGCPERKFFEAAGKSEQFAAAQQMPAIYARCWSKP